MSKKKNGYTLIECVMVMLLTAIFFIAFINISGMTIKLLSFADNKETILDTATARKFLFSDIKNADQISLISITELIMYQEEEIVTYSFLKEGLCRNNEIILRCNDGYFDVTNTTVCVTADPPLFFLRIEGDKLHEN